MRLWSLHPRYLDSKGLVALWRETLLAQNVLAGKTIGYKNHPQLNRFKTTVNPAGAIADEADQRNYNFDRSKISNRRLQSRISVTDGQLSFERNHLLAKLKVRDPARYSSLKKVKTLGVHPLFFRVKGGVAPWEIKV